MNEDINKYMEAFLSEANNHIKNMNLALINWEKHPGNKKNLQDIFRNAHTFKSISATMGFQQIANLNHAIEDLLDAIRTKKITLKKCINLLFNCFDFLKENIKKIAKGQPEFDTASLIEKINLILTNNEKQGADLSSLELFSGMESITSVEVNVDRLDKLLNLTKELLINKMRLESLSETLQSSELTATLGSLNQTLNELQYYVMQIRLVPIGFVFDRFSRMVRDLAEQQKKQVEFYTEGREIEVDRSLIDAISESLAHLIKNAIDHGLETSEIRKTRRKSVEGSIKLRAKRQKESVVIEVSDDGAGLDLEAIKTIAVRHNLLSTTAAKAEVTKAIFSGISTAEKVTDISGRGLGLSIVKQTIESINGSIEVETEKGKGTQFIIKIPLTLTVILVLLIRQGNQIYALPLNSIERLITIPYQDIASLLHQESFVYDEMNVPLLRLSVIFKEKVTLEESRQFIVVLRKEEELLGVIVDSLLTTEEIITQPINPTIRGSKLFSGTALLGSGETILIIDVDELFLCLKSKQEG
ncbi:chemotaxis protein CheA [Legionella sp. WA2024007413]